MSDTVTNYRPMWSELGLDLAKHDTLLKVLGQCYQEVFASQRHRPEGMKYFDFVMSEVHGLRIKELQNARKAGRRVVGSYCVFVPEELILAVDGISVGLCAGADFGTDQAERYLPRTTCALIKSFFGFALEKVCPYLAACDLVVGENTCDGKKKAYETFQSLVPRFHLIDLPQVKSPEGRALMTAEYRRFAKELETLAGKQLTVQSLKRAIELVNRKRSAVHRLAGFRQAKPAPISGLDSLLINQVYFYDDPDRFTTSVNALCDELDQRVAKGVGVAPMGAVRLVVSGCPMALPNWKIPAVVEQAGGVIVGEESCVGERGTQTFSEARGNSVEELINALVDRYWTIDCAFFTPNPSRLEHVRQMIGKTGADGIIHYGLQFCTPYQIEAFSVEQILEKAGISVLRIDTDYSPEDVGQIRTRVEAFLERIRDQKQRTP